MYRAGRSSEKVKVPYVAFSAVPAYIAPSTEFVIVAPSASVPAGLSLNV